MKDGFYTITESDSNTNGDYIKFSDGSMICYRNIVITIASVNAWGTLYDGSTNTVIKFAQPFVQTPRVSVTPTYSAFVERVVADSNGINTITVARPTSVTNWNVPLDIIAVGKWK